MNTPTLTPAQARILLDNLDHSGIAQLPSPLWEQATEAKNVLTAIANS